MFLGSHDGVKVLKKGYGNSLQQVAELPSPEPPPRPLGSTVLSRAKDCYRNASSTSALLGLYILEH